MRPFDIMDRRAVTAIRTLAIDQVEQARSGHPGMPLGCAPLAYVLWSRFLKHDPDRPDWPDRDRFVLSAGHGSALLYALLHLFGYDLPLDELRRFRQLGSRTPGHPERGLTPGVEITTGPLGQGFAAAVGMAIAERHLAAEFNREGFPVVAHRTWVLASDGDLMEGISSEAAALAGHLKLGRLAVVWDDNRITIDGPTTLAWSEDVAGRFAALGWRVAAVEDGEDLDAIARALEAASAAEDAPVLLRVRTHIGFGSPTKQDSPAAHGAPLGPAEAAATKRALGWDIEEPFAIPPDVVEHVRRQTVAGRAASQAWDRLRERYAAAYPELAQELARRLAGELPPGWDAALPVFSQDRPMATREASGAVIAALAPAVPELVGGSADLAASNNTAIPGSGDFSAADPRGRNLRFGVREHAMAAIANGLALHGGVRPFAATFLVFSDYLRPSLRLAALMGLPVIYVFTHDSIAVGEDGPTHQPVEHLASLRAVPNLLVLRPADANETAHAWRLALARRNGPTALVLSRQKLPVFESVPFEAFARGAFVVHGEGRLAEATLLASGSEVSLARKAAAMLADRGIAARVVSVPCRELFASLPEAERASLLGGPDTLPVVVEAGRGAGWGEVTPRAECVTLERFGASGPGEAVAEHFGFTPEQVAGRVVSALARRRAAPIRPSIPAPLAPVVAGRQARLESLHVPQRLRARDASLWGERFAKGVARRLGWLDLPGRACQESGEWRTLVDRLAQDGIRTLYLLGMGGSSLAPAVLRSILGNPSGRELVVLDTTDPQRVAAVLDTLDPATSAVVAVSKSGTTVETSALTDVLWDRFRSALGAAAGDHFLAVTEHGTPLERLAIERGFRASLPHPIDVGGRYSALCVVGLLPALWLGHPVDAILEGATRALCGLGAAHPAVELGVLTAAVAPGGWGKLAWCASPRLAPLGGWVEQLVAESTGKEGKGILPVVLPTLPDPSAAWPDTLYLAPRFFDEDAAQHVAAARRLAEAGLPVVQWELTPTSLGEAFVVLEVATAVAALLLGVNPFDEPDVVRAKEQARAILAKLEPASLPPTPDPRAALNAHLAGLDPLDAVALLAYLPETEAVAAALEDLRAALSARLGVAVTPAFGPRYLHSTGQLHKGGPDHVVPVLLTSHPTRDVAVPHKRFTLGQLRRAQALGDFTVLQELGRRVLHIHLGTEPEAALRQLTDA